MGGEAKVSVGQDDENVLSFLVPFAKDGQTGLGPFSKGAPIGIQVHWI